MELGKNNKINKYSKADVWKVCVYENYAVWKTSCSEDIHLNNNRTHFW